MNTEINQRFKALRIESGKSQEEWGKIFGITKSGVSDIERGKRDVTEKHLVMLSNWREQRVNIDWLKTGNGDMFLQLPQEDELASYISLILEESQNPFCDIMIQIMKTYAELTPKSQEALQEFCSKLKVNMSKEKEEA